MSLNEENILKARITAVEARIKALDQERDALLGQLSFLQKARLEKHRESAQEAHPPYGVTAEGPIVPDKVALIRKLFRGREDVYALRWESWSTGKSGYQPACGNEWNPDLCGKSKESTTKKKKCSECEHRELLPLTDQVVQRHISGIAPGGAYRSR